DQSRLTVCIETPTLKWPPFTFSASASLSFSMSTDAAVSPCGPWPTIEVGPSVARSTPLTQLAGTSANAADDKNASAPTATLDASGNLTGDEVFIVVLLGLPSSRLFFEADDMPLPGLLIAG